MADKALPIERRNFLLNAFGALPVLALATGETGLLSGCTEPTPAAPKAYEPRYFNSAEWAFVKAATDRLIPASEDGPGALEAGVPEFIDRQMETDYGHGGRWYLQGPFDPTADYTLGYQLRFTPREFYRAAVPDIDAWCAKAHDKTFAELAPAQQDDVLSKLESGAIELPHVRASEFFSQLLNNSKEGYFADPMYGGNRGMAAWSMIGFPGARADFADWSRHPGKPYPLGPVSILGEKA